MSTQKTISPCTKRDCWGRDVLPRVPHYHDYDQQHFNARYAADYIAAVPGASERVQLELPLDAPPETA